MASLRTLSVAARGRHAARRTHSVGRCTLLGRPGIWDWTGARAFARVAATPLGPAGAPRTIDDDDAEDALSHVVAMDSLVPVASAYHKHAEGFTDAPFDSLEEMDDSPYDEEFPENRKLGEALKPAKRSLGTLGVLQRLAVLEKGKDARRDGKDAPKDDAQQGARSSRERKPWFHFGDDLPVRVRVLDVDALSLQDLHRAFMHSLVRRRPAEVCIHVASRLAQFRDKYKHQSYENLLRDCGKLFGPTHGPELVALFSRCHATISVPYMVDYTRRYGEFSRAFIAGQVERSLRPAFFDFMRYEKKGGLRALPPTVSRPWALSSYTRLMAKSSIKSTLHEQLVLHGHIPAKELQSDTAADLPVETRLDERLSEGGALHLAPPSSPRAPRGTDRHRPALLDAIMEAEYSGVGWEGAEAAKKDEDDSAWEAEDAEDSEEGEEDKALRSRFGMQFQHVVPDEVFATGPKDALLDPSQLSGAPRRELNEDELTLPGRWWGSTRRLFFRHQHQAYRMIGDRWQIVPDPRGPRYKPKRRHKPRSMEREDKLKSRMRSEGVDNNAS